MFANKTFKKINFLFLLILASNVTFPHIARANSNLEIPANEAIRHSSEIFIAPGRITVISFEDGEIITKIEPSDNHRIIYNTNLPIEEGKATHIAITQIQKLPHHHATVSNTPNLIVFTTNANATYHAAYEFNLNLNSLSNRGVRIIDTPVEEKTTWNTKFGHAHVSDIQNGFDLAHREGKITAEDGHKIRTFLSLVRNGNSIETAITKSSVSIELIDILAEMGLKHFHRRLRSRQFDSKQIRCDGNSCSPSERSPVPTVPQ